MRPPVRIPTIPSPCPSRVGQRSAIRMAVGAVRPPGSDGGGGSVATRLKGLLRRIL